MTIAMRPDAELKALPHLDWRTILDLKPDAEPLSKDDIEILDHHFHSYVQVPIEEKPDGRVISSCDCVACGNKLGGTGDVLKDFMLRGPGGFTWGIAHGEGHCSYCGWPCTAHHQVMRKDGTTIVLVRNFILRYHPEYVQCDAVRHRMRNRLEDDE